MGLFPAGVSIADRPPSEVFQSLCWGYVMRDLPGLKLYVKYFSADMLSGPSKATTATPCTSESSTPTATTPSIGGQSQPTSDTGSQPAVHKPSVIRDLRGQFLQQGVLLTKQAPTPPTKAAAAIAVSLLLTLDPYIDIHGTTAQEKVSTFRTKWAHLPVCFSEAHVRPPCDASSLMQGLQSQFILTIAVHGDICYCLAKQRTGPPPTGPQAWFLVEMQFGRTVRIPQRGSRSR